jgi:F-box/WD-40 domain protein 7
MHTSAGSTELVVGSANHSLYAIDILDYKKKPVELYGKKYGHTDWVSGVAHLADGRVVSCGMDSKICLWSPDKRSNSEVHAHSGSIHNF